MNIIFVLCGFRFNVCASRTYTIHTFYREKDLFEWQVVAKRYDLNGNEQNNNNEQNAANKRTKSWKLALKRHIAIFNKNQRH